MTALLSGIANPDVIASFEYAVAILHDHEISEDNHKGIANYLAVAGKAKARDRVQALFAECLREIEPYGKAAEPLREIASYVTGRTE